MKGPDCVAAYSRNRSQTVVDSFALTGSDLHTLPISRNLSRPARRRNPFDYPRHSAAFQAGCTALIDHDHGDDAMTSVRLDGRYEEPVSN